MTVELVASRLIARFLGSSLYTWTGVLSVILAGISLGNYWGGWMADRARNLPGRIETMFFAGAAACVAILWLNAAAGGSVFLLGLSWPARILLHMTWAFLLPATILGTISPMVAKLALDRSTHTGRTIGTLYAWNAVGSIAGTLFTGFYLMEWMGSVRIVLTMALLQALLGTAYAWNARRRPPAGALAALGLVAAVFLLGVLPGDVAAMLAAPLKLRDGPTEPHAIYFSETLYQTLTVTAEGGNPNHRAFYQDKLRHSEVDLADWSDLKYPYMRIYDALVNRKMGKNSDPVRLLLLGGGGYVFPNYLARQRPGSELVVVEIDPGVTRAAQAAFGLPPDAPIEIHHLDARQFVAEAVRQQQQSPTSLKPFDFIICDSVSDYSVPYQLTTREFLEQVRQLLKPEGLYLMNLIDVFDSGAFLNAMAQTFAAVFPHWGAVASHPERNMRTTTVLVGAQQPLDLDRLGEWTTRPGVLGGRVLTADDFAELRERNGIRLLTDDFAPVENLLAPVVRGDVQGRMEAALRAGIRAAEKEDYRRAVRHFRKATELAPDQPEPWENLGQALEMIGDDSGALEAYAAILQQDPRRVQARNRAALVLWRRGHRAAALEQWAQSLQINPAQPEVLNNLGAAAMDSGDREQAIAYWRQALVYAPHAEILRKNLAAAGALEP